MSKVKNVTLKTQIMLDGKIVGEATYEMVDDIFKYRNQRGYHITHKFENVAGEAVKQACAAYDEALVEKN